MHYGLWFSFLLIYHPITELFAPKKIKDTPVAQPPTPTTPGDPKNIGIWTEDDDLCLIQLIVQYSFNWSLITDAFNSIRVPVTGEHRTPWQLHERWRQNNLTSLSGQVSPGKRDTRSPVISLLICLNISFSLCIETQEGCCKKTFASPTRLRKETTTAVQYL